MKKKLLLLLAMVMLLSVPATASAAQGDKVEVQNGGTIVRENLTESEIIPRNTYLFRYYTSLTDRGNGVVRVFADTECYAGTAPFRVRVYTYLQQYINGAWKTIETVSDYHEYDDYVSVHYDAYVDQNYYYRVMSVHVATDRVIREEATQYTDALWVD